MSVKEIYTPDVLSFYEEKRVVPKGYLKALDTLEESRGLLAKEPDVVEGAKLAKRCGALRREYESVKEELIQRCKALFEQVISGPLKSIVLFQNSLPSSEIQALLLKYGVTAGDKTQCGERLEKQLPYREGGAIFHDNPWSLPTNDAFIFGAIQARKIVYVSGSVLSQEGLWNEENQRPTTLGREIALLSLAGYRKGEAEESSQFKLTLVPPEVGVGVQNCLELLQTVININKCEFNTILT